MIKVRVHWASLWILLIGFGQLQLNFCGAQDFSTNNTLDGDILPRESKSNYSEYLFGLPPMQIDPALGVPGVRDDDDFEHWIAPIEFQKSFPYYLSGFDLEGHPIWIAEWGRYDMSTLVVTEEKTKELFEKFTRQAVYAIIKSRQIKSTPEKPVNRHIFVIDFEGLQPKQIANPLVVDYCLKLARKYRRFFEKNIHKMILVNVNFVAETLINLARPLFGRMLDRVESYGTNKAVFVQQFLKKYPKDQLPDWYGGSKDHKPVYVLG